MEEHELCFCFGKTELYIDKGNGLSGINDINLENS